MELELLLDENRVCVGMCGKKFWNCWSELLAKETVCVCVVGEMRNLVWFENLENRMVLWKFRKFLVISFKFKIGLENALFCFY